MGSTGSDSQTETREEAAVPLTSVGNHLWRDLRRACGWLRGRWGFDRCARRRRECARIDTLTWKRKLVDVVDAEFERAVLVSVLGD